MLKLYLNTFQINNHIQFLCKISSLVWLGQKNSPEKAPNAGKEGARHKPLPPPSLYLTGPACGRLRSPVTWDQSNPRDERPPPQPSAPESIHVLIISGKGPCSKYKDLLYWCLLQNSPMKSPLLCMKRRFSSLTLHWVQAHGKYKTAWCLQSSAWHAEIFHTSFKLGEGQCGRSWLCRSGTGATLFYNGSSPSWRTDPRRADRRLLLHPLAVGVHGIY